MNVSVPVAAVAVEEKVVLPVELKQQQQQAPGEGLVH